MTRRQPGAVVPMLSRAGLGNLMFPWLKAAEVAELSHRRLVPPVWTQLRVGPYLRREHDTREYWRLFGLPRPGDLAQRAWLSPRAVAIDSSAPDAWRGQDARVLAVRGMGDYFAQFEMPGTWHRDFLLAAARPTAVGPPRVAPYLAMHVRRGDFAPAPTARALDRNNVATPLAWFTDAVHAVRRHHPGLDIVVCSDGDDDELAPLLALPRVERASGANALEDMMTLSRAVGILGSRSTFSAWGAFLGEVPMLTQVGGNAYAPHDAVWESDGSELPAPFSAAVARHRDGRKG